MQKITNCIKSERVGKQESVIKRLKDLFQNQCHPLSQSNCDVLFRKRIHNEWFCIEDHGDSKPNKRIFLRNPVGQEQ